MNNHVRKLFRDLDNLETLVDLDKFQFDLMFCHDDFINRGDLVNANVINDIITVGERIIADAPKLRNVAEVVSNFATDARNYLNNNYVAA